MLIWSYVRSTDFTARESGQNILSGIYITVVVGGAGRTIPRPDIQWQLLHNVTTMPTPFRTRKPAVYLDKVATIPVALIFKLSDQLTPTSITDGLRQFPILDHILQGQILNGDGLVFTHQSSRQ